MDELDNEKDTPEVEIVDLGGLHREEQILWRFAC